VVLATTGQASAFCAQPGDASKRDAPAAARASTAEGNGACQAEPDRGRAIVYRAARLSDSLDLARLLCVAGGGLYEFLFDGIVPFMTATEFLAAGIAGDDSPISHRNCFVAVDATSDRVLGAANVFPADLLGPDTYPLVPLERQVHIRPLLQLRDRGSMFLNALAVDESCRGTGIGARLLDWAKAEARSGGFDRLSLHVWADNTAAREFYKLRGFVDVAVAEVASHPRLAHRGGSVLMSCTLAIA
jgi:ribosomal protein S18 acetylase RimI-like enzyme